MCIGLDYLYILFVVKGVEEIDQIFTVLLKTSMAVGGIIALIFDNIIPGTPEERGIQKWRSLVTTTRGRSIASVHVYDIPFGLTNKWKFAKYIPFLPYYGEEVLDVEMTGNAFSNTAVDEDIRVASSSENANTHM